MKYYHFKQRSIPSPCIFTQGKRMFQNICWMVEARHPPILPWISPPGRIPFNRKYRRKVLVWRAYCVYHLERMYLRHGIMSVKSQDGNRVGTVPQPKQSLPTNTDFAWVLFQLISCPSAKVKVSYSSTTLLLCGLTWGVKIETRCKSQLMT